MPCIFLPYRPLYILLFHLYTCNLKQNSDHRQVIKLKIWTVAHTKWGFPWKGSLVITVNAIQGSLKQSVRQNVYVHPQPSIIISFDQSCATLYCHWLCVCAPYIFYGLFIVSLSDTVSPLVRRDLLCPMRKWMLFKVKYKTDWSVEYFYYLYTEPVLNKTLHTNHNSTP